MRSSFEPPLMGSVRPAERAPPVAASRNAVRLARAVSWLLGAGVVISALVTIAGGFVYLRGHGADQPAFSEFRPSGGAQYSVAGVLRSAAKGDGRGLIELGLLLLIATPVARVAISLAEFVRERDWTYVALTAVVLGVLATSLITAY
jgi:uncharacterized membrane protein